MKDEELDKELDHFRSTPVNELSRGERRSRLKFYKKELESHEKNKPKVDINENDPEKLEQRVHQIRAWTTRYGILTLKIKELDEFKANNKRVHKQDSE